MDPIINPNDYAPVVKYLDVTASAIKQWGPVLVFWTMFLECVPAAGFFVPGMTILITIGFLAPQQSPSDGVLIFLAALFGVIVSDTLAFGFGRLGQTRIPIVRRLIDRNESLRQEIQRQKFAVLLLYQFPPYSRMFAPLLMGAMAFSLRRWATIVTVGSLAFVLSFYAIGFVAGVAGRELFGAISAASAISTIFVLALLAWLFLLVRKLLRARKLSKKPV